MYVKFIDLKPNKKLRWELAEVYHRVIGSGIYLDGKETKRFEQEWADYTHQKYCIGLGSGYDGLLLAITVCDYEGEILVPDLTIPLVYNAVKNCNCESILYSQADDRLYNVGIKVHLYGQRDRTQLNCKYLIGDYSQAHGLTPKEAINIWSFYPTKNLGGYGNNGAITTNSQKFYDRILQLKNCQKVNSKMDELQAGFLRIKLRYLKQDNEKRKQLAQLYVEGLQDINEIELPNLDSSVTHQFVIKTNNRDDLRKFLTDKGIETMVHYENMPDVLSLPIAPHLTQKEINYVVTHIKSYKEKK